MVSVIYRRTFLVPLNSVFYNTLSRNNSINFGVLPKCAFKVYTSSISGESKQQKRSGNKTDEKVYISLTGTDGIPKVRTLDSAYKLSKRRDLRLIKVSDYDPRTQTPTYNLITNQQCLGEEIAHKKQNKGKFGFKTEKIISISHNICGHDLKSKSHKILKWIQKGHGVNVTISGSSSEESQAQDVFNKIEGAVNGTGRILQKRISGGGIKFQIVLLKEKKKEIEACEKVNA